MTLVLTLETQPEVPLEAEAIVPERLEGLSEAEIAKQPVLHGNRQAELGDFFKVDGGSNGQLRVIGDLSRVKLLGAGMSRGRLVIEGKAGLHLGTAMTGGEILVEGSASDWVGPEMRGGRILVTGDAGHAVGSAYRGSQVGMRGGEIIVHGKAGNEVGNTMRNGLIAIGGTCGDFAGVNMLAGTIVVFGALGIRAGAGMKRGSVIAMTETEVLPSFTYACRYHPPFLPLYLLHLKTLGLPVSDRQVSGIYRRWSGDAVEMNRGELLVHDA